MVWRRRKSFISPGSVRNFHFYITKNLVEKSKDKKNIFDFRGNRKFNNYTFNNYIFNNYIFKNYIFNNREDDKIKKNLCNYYLNERTFCRYSEENIIKKKKKKEKIYFMNKDERIGQINIFSLPSWLRLKYDIIEIYKKKNIYNIMMRKYLNNIYIYYNYLKNRYLKIYNIYSNNNNNNKYVFIKIKENIFCQLTKTFINVSIYKNFLLNNNILRRKLKWTDMKEYLENIRFNYNKMNIFLFQKISSLYYKNKSNIYINTNIIYYKNMFLFYYKTSPVTYTLILLHIFVYLLWNIAQPSRNTYNYNYINNFKYNNNNNRNNKNIYTNPLLSTDTMYKYFSCSLKNLREKKLYTLVTNLISHNTIESFLLNTISLYYIGTALERIIQSKNFFITYLISGILSSYIQILYHKNNYNNIYVFGASGSVSSILTTYTFMYPFQNIYLYGILALPLALFSSLYFLNEIYCVLSDRQDNTGHIAHLTGMGLGFIYYYFFIKKGRLLR
ncbi:rhomboid protease ROM9 [Plasmodium gaboni]|uniref:Rhomboid protease ROM9 n=1 Tax=Plasmodium gaboni TaxID=647221 RepID=A0ABY1UIN0_9APIC|nr:rhomboid protease ROM9 [Plasmodium gaboni]